MDITVASCNCYTNDVHVTAFEVMASIIMKGIMKALRNNLIMIIITEIIMLIKAITHNNHDDHT